jgi:Cu+-exporting ATPase
MKNERVTLPIYNLGCGGGGSLTIERALTKVPGVTQAYVNPATEMAYVVYNPALAQPDELAAAIARAGFGPPISATRGENAAPQHARPALDARRLALAAGIWLAALYTLCVVAALLFPAVFQMYRFWEAILIGVDWTNRWTLPLGLAEAFLYGALGAWLLIAIYRAVPARPQARD